MILRFALGPDISQGDDWDKICNAAAEFGAAVSIAADAGRERRREGCKMHFAVTCSALTHSRPPPVACCIPSPGRVPRKLFRDFKEYASTDI